MKNKAFVQFIISAFLLFFLSGWGYQGHHKISYNAGINIPEELKNQRNWQVELSTHASDADYRKGSDENEGPKHYIDIDNYSDFLQNGEIPQNYDEVIEKYGYSFVEQNGFLPWATLATYDSLVSAFVQNDAQKIILYASDLGHYVADGHMPLHLTRNYNGQFTNQYGVHSRFESDMINRYVEDIQYETEEAKLVHDVSDYVFSYIYNNYEYLELLLDADADAVAEAGNDYSDTYYQIMWDTSAEFTTELFCNASQSITNLIYTAWYTAQTINPSSISLSNQLNVSIYPNPADTAITLCYTKHKAENATICIFDMSGKQLITIAEIEKVTGRQTIDIPVDDLQSGTYLLRIKINDEIAVKQIVVK